jgi:hypothetical protein
MDVLCWNISYTSFGLGDIAEKDLILLEHAEVALSYSPILGQLSG